MIVLIILVRHIQSGVGTSASVKGQYDYVVVLVKLSYLYTNANEPLK